MEDDGLAALGAYKNSLSIQSFKSSETFTRKLLPLPEQD